jgi:hypothetical protein
VSALREHQLLPIGDFRVGHKPAMIANDETVDAR